MALLFLGCNHAEGLQPTDLLVDATRPDGGDPCGGPRLDSAQCRGGDLNDYCATGACGSYSDELAPLRSPDTCAPFPTGTRGLVRIGTCGALRFIELQGLGIGYKLLRFYDGDGVLVAVQVSSDTNQFCNDSAFSQHFGTLPQCQPVTTEVVCRASLWPCG